MRTIRYIQGAFLRIFTGWFATLATARLGGLPAPTSPPRRRARISLLTNLACGSLFTASANLPCHAGVGGGFTQAGLHGKYFTNPNLSGTPAFTRRDIRLDFSPTPLPPGGAGRVGDASFRAVSGTSFSAQWTGQWITRFAEPYTLKVLALGRCQVRLRPAGQDTWTNLLDQASPGGQPTLAAFPAQAGATYDVEITYQHDAGPWSCQLRWSSPSTPEEVIDPLVSSGINNPDWSAGFTDIVKGARNSWEGINGGARPPMDVDGWPLGDGAYVFQESLNQGLDVDPLMRGKITFTFHGRATVSLQGNVQNGSLTYTYDPAQNLTTGSFVATPTTWNASYFRFSQATRNGQPGGPPGLTDLKLLRPLAPDADASFAPSTSLFTPVFLEAMSHFAVIRHQLVANQQRDWTERTRPTFFNQQGGSTSPAHYGIGDPSNNGASWEHKILLANESGRDLMISLPPVASGRTAADTASYLVKLAQLLRYGSDGAEPYAEIVADPIYPPLNPNLRVYLEIGNELWNWASVFYVDWANINALAAADAAANNTDFEIINFDGLSTARDNQGQYASMNTWRYRKIMLRLHQISDIFRAVFGDDAMLNRIRPIYEWQYANDNDTARLALTFADRYFNNGDGQPHVAEPQPIRSWLWGGGGAAYYGAFNGNGLTDLVPDPAFALPALTEPGYAPRPSPSPWTFAGTAGLARPIAGSSEIPPAFRGGQMAYLTDRGEIGTTVVFPTNPVSSVYGVSFKAVNRTAPGTVAADQENLRVYLDGTNDITARTFSQGRGYTPSAYDPNSPWAALNVFWTRSEYYFSRSFSVEPGSTHTITVRGQGHPTNPALTNQTAFIGEFRVTAVDRIFADGMPGGGEATGQPIGQNIQRTMNVEASWAKAFGLEELSYESGWSLGGDDGGSWVQLKAKYGDPRTADVQERFMNMFHAAGSAINVFGTYAQWPSWADYYAEQGLLNVGRYPIVQGIDANANRLPPEPSNGTLVPAVLTARHVTLSDNANASLGRIQNAGGWLAWNILVPQSGTYQIALSTGTNGTGVLLLDDLPLAEAQSGTRFLTRGLHSVKTRSVSTNAWTIQNVAVATVGAPASPASTSVIDGNAQATLSWSAVTGATAYMVRFGTTPGQPSQSVLVGDTNAWTVTGLTNNQQYYFEVLAGNASGWSLPAAERGVIPLGPGQVGSLAVWEFNGFSGEEPAAPPSSASARLTVNPLRRGSGLSPSQSDWAATMRVNRFASEPAASAGHSYGTNEISATAKSQYYEFTLQAIAGQKASLQQLAFHAFFQSGAGSAFVTYSADGAPFSAPLPATGSPASSVGAWVVDLSGAAPLQNTTATIILRVYLLGLGPYQVSALGDPLSADVVLTGSLAPVNTALLIAPAGPLAITLSWPSNLPGLSLASQEQLDAASPWTPVTAQARLVDNRWVVTLPTTTPTRFFELSP